MAGVLRMHHVVLSTLTLDSVNQVTGSIALFDECLKNYYPKVYVNKSKV